MWLIDSSWSESLIATPSGSDLQIKAQEYEVNYVNIADYGRDI